MRRAGFSRCGGGGRVIIAGMGGETIEGILRRAPWTLGGARLVLQPQSKLDELCVWLRITGYGLEGAALAAEGERLYVVLAARGGAEGPIFAEDACAPRATHCCRAGWTRG